MATKVQIGQGTIGRISRRKSKKDRQLNNQKKKNQDKQLFIKHYTET